MSNEYFRCTSFKHYNLFHDRSNCCGGGGSRSYNIWSRYRQGCDCKGSFGKGFGWGLGVSLANWAMGGLSSLCGGFANFGFGGFGFGGFGCGGYGMPNPMTYLAMSLGGNGNGDSFWDLCFDRDSRAERRARRKKAREAREARRNERREEKAPKVEPKTVKVEKTDADYANINKVQTELSDLFKAQTVNEEQINAIQEKINQLKDTDDIHKKENEDQIGRLKELAAQLKVKPEVPKGTSGGKDGGVRIPEGKGENNANLPEVISKASDVQGLLKALKDVKTPLGDEAKKALLSNDVLKGIGTDNDKNKELRDAVIKALGYNVLTNNGTSVGNIIRVHDTKSVVDNKPGDIKPRGEDNSEVVVISYTQGVTAQPQTIKITDNTLNQNNKTITYTYENNTEYVYKSSSNKQQLYTLVKNSENGYELVQFPWQAGWGEADAS